jgi:excisionase family DNA binding protein
MTDPGQPQPTGSAVPRGEVGLSQGARLLTIEELAAATTLSVSTIRRLLKRGVIVGHQPGGRRCRIMFPPDAIERATGAEKQAEAEPAPGVSPPGATKSPPRGPQPKWLQRSKRQPHNTG